MKKLDIKQKSPEWHELRMKSIGASDAPVILGISPYKTPLQLWQQKLGLANPEPENDAMRRGNELEIVARDHLNQLRSLNYVPVVVQSSEYPFLIASLDGMSEFEDFIEIKYNTGVVHEAFNEKGLIPHFHMCQMQHQMLVTEKSYCEYVSINHLGEIISKKFKRDDDYIARLLPELIEFWNMLKSFTQPDVRDKDYIEKNDDEWHKLVKELEMIRKQLGPYEALKKREEEIRKELIQECHGRSCIGSGLKITKFLKKGAVDLERMCRDLSLLPEKLDQWRKDSIEQWRLTQI